MIAPGVVVSAVGLGALSVGPESGWSVFAGDALYLIGMGMGIWEVSMDVVGARVAHLLGNNAILPRLHATLSICQFQKTTALVQKTTALTHHTGAPVSSIHPAELRVQPPYRTASVIEKSSIYQ